MFAIVITAEIEKPQLLAVQIAVGPAYSPVAY